MIRAIKNFFHLIEAIAANAYYNFPSRGMTVIGITGTDGKTTTASMIAHILSEKGFKTAVITTIGAQINNKFYETGFHTTTPSSFYLQKYLNLAKKSGCTHAVIEVTSHALDQYRTRGIFFDVGVITNITHEHLDYHKTFGKYVISKSRLLNNSKVKILNYDDLSYKLLFNITSHENFYYYSLSDKNSLINASILPSNIKTLGEYNMQNALAAASACFILGISLKNILTALKTFKLPEGRLEVIHSDSFQVIVDFAHTPNAFEKTLSYLKKQTNNRLIHVFGAAGKRDKSKRAKMGKASSMYSDIIILTAEDPRGEDIYNICDQIANGIFGLKKIDFNSNIIKNKHFYTVITNRKKAIEFALKMAVLGDIILITGKGHEKTMNINGAEEKWNDKEVVTEILSKLS